MLPSREYSSGEESTGVLTECTVLFTSLMMFVLGLGEAKGLRAASTRHPRLDGSPTKAPRKAANS